MASFNQITPLQLNTNARKAGVAESVIVKITEHSAREKFDRYYMIDADDKRNGIEVFEKHLKKIDHTFNQNENSENITNE